MATESNLSGTRTRPKWRRRLRRTLIVVGAAVVLLVVGLLLLSKTRLLPVALRTPGFGPLIPATTREGRWRQDVNYLARNLPRLHRNAFHSVDRATFEEAVRSLDADIPQLSDDEISMRLLALVALIGDGHTSLGYQALYGGPDGWQIYGVALAWLDDGWYVAAALPEEQDLLGAEVLAVADVPVDELYAKVSPLISADNEMTRLAAAPNLMVTAQVLAALDLLDGPAQAAFDLRLVDGSETTRRLAPVDPVVERSRFLSLGDVYPAAADRLAFQRPAQWYWYTYLPDRQAIYFQYDRCAEMEDKPFDEFVTTLFAEVDSRPVQRIVVDLRFNGGGNSAILQPFLAELAARPQLSVYVLIGRQTFSSALMNAIELDQQANAVLVGEPTGGRPNHYGEVRHFDLPDSRLQVGYPIRYWRMLPDADPPSLTPEIATPITLENQLAGRDTALEAALAEGGVSP